MVQGQRRGDRQAHHRCDVLVENTIAGQRKLRRSASLSQGTTRLRGRCHIARLTIQTTQSLLVQPSVLSDTR